MADVGMADDLVKLEQLRKSGALTEGEFHAAKQTVLRGDDSLGRAANRYVGYNGVTQVIGVLVFLVVVLLLGSAACHAFGPTQ
jgi:hypothetical protein